MTKFRFLKGQCHKIFLLLVFFMNQFPPSPEYPIRTVSLVALTGTGGAVCKGATPLVEQ